MYDISNNGPDIVGNPDILGCLAYQQDIRDALNTSVESEVPVAPVSERMDAREDTNDFFSVDSFVSMTMETINFVISEFTKLFEVYAGIE